jgi:hypothetical protein
MDYLEEINKKVQQRLNQNHKSIIISYYQTLINNHNEFCGCNYCLILKEYVNLKISKSKFGRIYERIDFFDRDLELLYLNKYRDIELTIKHLKLQKDLLKKL